MPIGLRVGRDVRACNVRGLLTMATQKLTFNNWGWIVIAIERTGNYIQHLRFDTKQGAREFLKANPDAWPVQ